MTTGNLDPYEPSDAAWLEIEEVLEGLTTLAREDVPPETFYPKLLSQLIGVLAAAGGAVWTVREGQLVCQFEMQLEQTLAGDQQLRSQHDALIVDVLRSREAQLLPPGSSTRSQVNDTPWLLIVAPLLVLDEPLGVIEILQRPESRPALVDGYFRLVTAGCEIAEDYEKNRQLRLLQNQKLDAAQLLDFSNRVHESMSLESVASVVVGDGRLLANCDRMTLLLQRGSRSEVIAISGAASFDRRSQSLRHLETLAKLIARSGESLWYGDQQVEVAPQIEVAAEALVDETHARMLAMIPLLEPGDTNAAPLGVLAAEWFSRLPTDSDRRRLPMIAATVTPAVATAVEYESIPLKWLGRLRRKLRESARRRLLQLMLLVAVIGGSIAALILIPAELTVEASGELVPSQRQHLFAPADGVIVDLPPREGMIVQKNDLVARLESPTLAIRLTEVIGKLAKTEEDLKAAPTQLFSDDLPESGPGSRSELAARIEQLKEIKNGLLAEKQILEAENEQLLLKSPITGSVVTFDVARLLADRPVKRGELLLTIANLESPWQLELDLPDRRAGHLLRAASESQTPVEVTFVLGTDVTQVHRAKVQTIATATTRDEHDQSVVKVVAGSIDGQLPALRPGATVRAKFHCGQHPIGYVWMHELIALVRSWWVY